MLLADVCARIFRSCCEEGGRTCIVGALLVCEVTVLLAYSLMAAVSGVRRCAYRWTRPVGGGRWKYHLRTLLGVCWGSRRCIELEVGQCRRGILHAVYSFCLRVRDAVHACLSESASLHGYDVDTLLGVNRASWGHHRHKERKTFFPLFEIFGALGHL